MKLAFSTEQEVSFAQNERGERWQGEREGRRGRGIRIGGEGGRLGVEEGGIQVGGQEEGQVGGRGRDGRRGRGRDSGRGTGRGMCGRGRGRDGRRGEGEIQVLACIKAWVNEHAYNGEYMDILIMMTQN